MLYLLPITSLFYMTTACPTAKQAAVHPNIVGGFEVNIIDYPYQVAILEDGYLWCGGSILSEKFVLTAAHCILEATLALTVHAGTSFWAKGTVHHVEYNVTYGVSDVTDVAVLKIVEPFIFDKTRQPIRLFSASNMTTPGTIATVTGWGSTRNGVEKPTRKLRAVNVPMVDTRACNASYHGSVYETELCAGVTGKDSCQGDSGGPLTINGWQIGIVTTGYGCGIKNFPGIYASVSYFHDWIIEQISK